MNNKGQQRTVLKVTGESEVRFNPSFQTIEVYLGGVDGRQYILNLDGRMAADLSYGLLKGVKVAQGGNPNMPTHAFETLQTALLSYHGEDHAAGTVHFHLFGTEICYETIIGPELLGTLGTQIVAEIARMPNPPSTWIEGARATKPVDGTAAVDDVVHHFGQEYPRKSLELLGVFLIRANLLEAALVDLLMFLSGLNKERAEALFYSSANHKARLDMISALLPASDLDDNRCQQFKKLLDKAKKLASQRNALVHGEWKFKKDGFEVVEKRAVPTSKSQNRIAGHKELQTLCQRYNDLESEIRLFIASSALRIAENTR
jgi:hypothetical protein